MAGLACSGTHHVDFYETADSWNWTRKSRSPANKGDLERRYGPGCQWAGLAYHSCYPIRHRKSYSLPCILDHKLALYAEQIVSILSVQSYVLCSYLYSCLTSGNSANPVVRRRWFYLSSLLLLAPFTLYVGLNARTFGSQPECNNTVKSSGSPTQWQRASPGSGDSGFPSSSSTSQWPLFMGCSWYSSGNERGWVQHRAVLFVGMDYSSYCKYAKCLTYSTTAYQMAFHSVLISFLQASWKQRYALCIWLWDANSATYDCHLHRSNSTMSLMTSQRHLLGKSYHL